jgi:hypothetical protein
MPVIRDSDQQLHIGDYRVNRRTGVVIQIMDIDLSGTCRVQDIRAPINSDPDTWQQLTESQITSCLWQPIDRTSKETKCPTE